MKNLFLLKNSMKNKIKISVVNYLNSIPFKYGLHHINNPNLIDVSEDVPSECALKLQQKTVDIGLIPIAAISDIKSSKIISNYCIGANNYVKSVALYSNSPLHRINKIILDDHSRTSVLLAKILAKHKWHINPVWENGIEGFENSINENEAGVIIGDKTFAINEKFKYKYDLAHEWLEMTSLPFVFACWVSNCELSEKFITDFNNALKYGIENISQSLDFYQSEFIKINKTEAYNYLTQNIDYNLNNSKKQAIEKFNLLSKTL